MTGATAALYLINRLLSGYGSDERVTRVLDTRAFYVVPRLNPDGAELALADRPRSSGRAPVRGRSSKSSTGSTRRTWTETAGS